VDAQELKEYIINNPDYIQTLLESVDCHSIKNYTNEIRCALPNRNNSTAVRIKKETLTGAIFSDDNTTRGDIYTILMAITNKSFTDILKHCHNVLGFKYHYDILEELLKQEEQEDNDFVMLPIRAAYAAPHDMTRKSKRGNKRHDDSGFDPFRTMSYCAPHDKEE
jgi:hypothetical protein